MSDYAWTEPKIDWSAGTGASIYDGDRFTYRDFNRIKNNIMYLYELATQIYPINAEIARREADPSYYFTLTDGYADRTITDFIYADEANFFEERLDFLKTTTGVQTPGSKSTFNDNGIFMHANQLNYIEQLTKDLKEFLYPMFISRRRFAFTLSQATNHMDF